MFFTDRALYRPGQTIHYKGVCFSADPQGDRYQTLSSRSIKVVLRDANGEEVEMREHHTNRYGSFSGSFTAPRDRVMGQMTIAVVSGPDGYGQVRVEEYKRPKFFVTCDAPRGSGSLE